MKAETPRAPALTPKKRCAIYTRKSTDEGLDQEYNSLEAQRDSALAFISSQRHEGWLAIDDGYDDGGFSGGNINRPSLKRLLDDVEDGRVDVVVVYKIDRLSRSLADFAKIIDLFDRHGVTFVSVTQQFNTTTSMGRLGGIAGLVVVRSGGVNVADLLVEALLRGSSIQRNRRTGGESAASPIPPPAPHQLSNFAHWLTRKLLSEHKFCVCQIDSVLQYF